MYIKCWFIGMVKRPPPFRTNRGIRQGDPLSPYLIILYIERLRHIIDLAVDKGLCKLIRLCHDGPKLSCLFFVDDLILLNEASSD